MSETPHTDAREVCPFSIPRNKLAVPSDFARRLERELAAERESFRLHREKVRDEEEKLHVQIMELKCHLVAERARTKELTEAIQSILPDPPYHPLLEPEWVYLNDLVNKGEAAP